MNKITVSINIGNAAFDDGYSHVEMARILRELAYKIEEGSTPESTRDINGNKVGTVSYE